MKRFNFAVAVLTVMTVPAFAQSVDEVNLALNDFLAQVFEAVKSFGGMHWAAKVVAVVMIIISSMKVTFFRELVWEKLGFAKVFVAPVLGLIAGVVSLYMTAGVEVTGAGVVAYMLAGSGSILVHQILDAVKQIPGLGPTYINMVDFISMMLGGKKNS